MSYSGTNEDTGVGYSMGGGTRKKSFDLTSLIPYAGQAFSILGSVIGAGKTQAQKDAEAKLPGLESGMKTGIGLNDVGNMAPLAIKSAMPQVNAIASSMGSKYGRSGYAKGAAVSGLVNGLSPELLRLLQLRLQNNQQNLRQMYSTNAQIAAGAQ